MAGTPLIIKLSVQDEEIVRRALSQLGTEGEKSLGRIQQAARKAGTDVSLFGQMAKTADDGMNRFGAGLGRVTGLLGTFGVGLSVAGLVAWTKSTIDAVGGLGEMAQQLGVTTDGLQAMRAAAAGAGASAEQMDQGISLLTAKIGEAADGTDAAIKAFNRLGVGVLNARKEVRSTEDVMVDIAVALKGVGSEAQQAAIMKDLFGKSGQKLLPVMEELADGADTLKTKYRDLGHVVGEDVIKRFDKASDDIAAAGMKITVAFANFISRLKVDDAIVTLLERITGAFSEPTAAQDAEFKRAALLNQLVDARDHMNVAVADLSKAEAHLATLIENSNGEATVAIERTQTMIGLLQGEVDIRLAVAQAIGVQLVEQRKLAEALKAPTAFQLWKGIGPGDFPAAPIGRGNSNPIGEGEASKLAAAAEKAAAAIVKEAEAYRELEIAMGNHLATARQAADEAETQNRITELEILGTATARDEIVRLTEERIRAAGAIERQRVEIEQLNKVSKLEASAAAAFTAGDIGFSDAYAGQAKALLADLDALLADIDRKTAASIRGVGLNEANRFAGDVRRVSEELASDFTDFVTDAWFAFRVEGIDSFDDVWDAALKGGERFIIGLLARIAEEAFVIPITTEIVGAMPGLFGVRSAANRGGGPAAGPGGGAYANYGGFGGGGWFGGGGGMSPAEMAAMAETGVIPTASPGWGQHVLPIASAGVGVAGFASNPNIASGIGAAGGVASAVMSFIPALAAAAPYVAAAAMVASVIASAVFKKKPSVGPGQSGAFLQGADELEVFRLATDNGGSMQTAREYGRGVPKSFDEIFDAMGGGRFVTGAGFNIGNNQKEGFSYAVYGPGQTPGGREAIADAKNLKDAAEAVSQAFLVALREGLVEGISTNFETALAKMQPETQEDLEDIVNRVKAYEGATAAALDLLDPKNSGLGKLLAENAAAFDGLKESALELGLAIEPLNARMAEIAEGFRDAFVEELERNALAASGRGYLNAVDDAIKFARSQELSNAAGFANDPTALAYNQGLINTGLAGDLGKALSGLNAEELADVVAEFGAGTDATAVYIKTLVDSIIALGGAAEEAATGLTAQGQGLLDQLGVRELRLGGQDRVALNKELLFGKERELAAALAEGFNPEQLGRLATVIDGELNKALAEFDAALVRTAEAAAEAAAAEEARLAAEAQANARASRDFDAALGIREARVGGDGRGALVLDLAAQKLAEIEAAEAAGRTAAQIARLAALLDGEAAKALADFDAGIGGVVGSIEDAAAALRAFNDDLALRRIGLSGDEEAYAVAQAQQRHAAEREEAARIAGANLAELEIVQGEEIAKIRRDFAERAAEEAARAAEDAARAAEEAAAAQARAAEEAARAAEEAMKRIADAMREGGAVMDDLRVRDLRVDGLDREADILAKQLANAEGLARIDALIAAGANNIDRGFAERVFTKELQAIIDGTNGGASGQRGNNYDPQAFDRFFTVSASHALVGANQNLRDEDFLRTIRQVDIATSNVIPFPAGGGSPIDGTAPAPPGYNAVRPFISASVQEVEGFFIMLRDPLTGIRADTTQMVKLLTDILAAIKAGAKVDVSFSRVPSWPAIADPDPDRFRGRFDSGHGRLLGQGGRNR